MNKKHFWFSKAIVIIALLFFLAVVFVIGRCLAVTPSEISDMDRWSGIGTVCTAIYSIIVGVITVWVMFDQQKTQYEFLEFQKREHQPNYILKIKKYYGYNKDYNDTSYEELLIRNVGHNSAMITDIKVDVFINCKMESPTENFTDRIRIYDYYAYKNEFSEGDLIYRATGTRNKPNYAFYDALLELSRNEHEKGIMLTFLKDIMVKIDYIDLYDESHSKYFRNGLRIDEKTYNKCTKYKLRHEASIDDFDFYKYKESLEA